MRSVVVEGVVAGWSAFARNALSYVTCLAISTGSETFHSIGVSFDKTLFETRIGWSVNPGRWSGSERSEEESDESDEMELGIISRPVDPPFPFSTSKIRGLHGLASAKGLGRGRWEAGAGVQARAPCGVFQIY